MNDGCRSEWIKFISYSRAVSVLSRDLEATMVLKFVTERFETLRGLYLEHMAGRR